MDRTTLWFNVILSILIIAVFFSGITIGYVKCQIEDSRLEIPGPDGQFIEKQNITNVEHYHFYYNYTNVTYVNETYIPENQPQQDPIAILSEIIEVIYQWMEG